MKRLRAIEGGKVFGAASREIYLVSSLEIPSKFKTPYFDKYKGHIFLKIHLIMYYQNMAAHVEEENLMIPYFQDSLSGASLK